MTSKIAYHNESCVCDACITRKMNAIREQITQQDKDNAAAVGRAIIYTCDFALAAIALMLLYLAGVGTLHWFIALAVCIALYLVSYLNHRSLQKDFGGGH